MKIGFTGTQIGMTVGQKQQFIELIKKYKPDEFHHGDCVGADAEAHDIVREFSPRTKIVGHIPIKNNKRAFKKVNEQKVPLDYLVRNSNIVKECDLLIAAPKEIKEVIRSGTWSTIRKAKKQGKPVIIIHDEGER